MISRPLPDPLMPGGVLLHAARYLPRSPVRGGWRW